MSCNGCRVLRKGCSDTCILRPCLQWIDTPKAQGHATLFLSKFFGRAGLMSFISAVPEIQRPSLFQSLLFEAAGRIVNPVNGAVGLLWTGNWHVCQASVETVLRGGALRPNFELIDGIPTMSKLGKSEEIHDPVINRRSKVLKRLHVCEPVLDFAPIKSLPEKRRLGSPSMNSDDSSVTTSGLREYNYSEEGRDLHLLNLFK